MFAQNYDKVLRSVFGAFGATLLATTFLTAAAGPANAATPQTTVQNIQPANPQSL
jgi:hypothetical protein